ncbi:hypothetical protein [Streptomyces sp. DT171]|uniref:hypothetical protein n=1 Tax=Streptomyces sp. DT171 TaxID=3416524 RepID=UPI003CF535A2
MGTRLAEQIAERRAGVGDPRALVGELRRALVLVPLDGGRLWTAASGGVRWVYGFTDEAALARFARAHEAGPEIGNGRLPESDRPGAGGRPAESGRPTEGRRPWEYAVLRGARLLDEIVPAMGEPAGVAVNVADPDGSMLFPPVLGIVPDAVAVDTDVPSEPSEPNTRNGGRG